MVSLSNHRGQAFTRTLRQAQGDISRSAANLKQRLFSSIRL